MIDFSVKNISNPDSTALSLAIETSGRTGSVAIGVGPAVLGRACLSKALSHSSELLPAIRNLLKGIGKRPCEIENLYISIGPGSFVGLRIAVAVAKTMHLASQTRIVAVDTLDAIASNLDDYIPQYQCPIKRAATILDAKRGLFYLAVFENKAGQFVKTLYDCLMTPAQFVRDFVAGNPIFLLGEGLLYYSHQFHGPGVEILPAKYWCPTATKIYTLGSQMAQKGLFANPLTLSPNYVRHPEAEEKARLSPSA
ncbi:MAG: tRNA (adenosine(37)-N6)-threonylcarbamoyltransferase complex dimerization subunit type 1 TsaB [Planctomycetota bacterium]